MYPLFSQETKKEKNKSGIYLIRVGKKSYVGSSIDIGGRLKEHSRELLKRKHHNIFLTRCFNKYPKDKWFFSVLEYIETKDQNMLKLPEKKWIEILQAELNIIKDPTTEHNALTTSKKVYQYNLQGQFLEAYPSASEAARQNKISKSMVILCCLDKIKSAGKFHWSYTPKKDFLYPDTRSKWKWVGVTMIDVNSLEEKNFRNIADCGRYIMEKHKEITNFGSLCSTISGIILKKGKRYKNYTFKKTEEAVIKSCELLENPEEDNQQPSSAEM